MVWFARDGPPKPASRALNTWGGDGRPWYGLRARPAAARAGHVDRFVKLRPATAGHSMVGARGARRRRAAGLSRLPRDVTGGTFAPKVQHQQIVDRLVKLGPAVAGHGQASTGHGMVCARGRSRPDTAGHGRSRPASTVTAPRGPASRGDVRPRLQQIVDRLVKLGPATARHSRPRPRGPAAADR